MDFVLWLSVTGNYSTNRIYVLLVISLAHNNIGIVGAKELFASNRKILEYLNLCIAFFSL